MDAVTFSTAKGSLTSRSTSGSKKGAEDGEGAVLRAELPEQGTDLHDKEQNEDRVELGLSCEKTGAARRAAGSPRMARMSSSRCSITRTAFARSHDRYY